jgi:cytochrome c-type biogenesis protein
MEGLLNIDLTSVSFLVACGISFMGGLLSFLSPCHLALVPVYISFITGLSVEELQAGSLGRSTGRVLAATLLFVLGFSTIYVGVGGVSGAFASFFGDLFTTHLHILEKIAGVVIILLGIYLLGFNRLGFLQSDLRLKVSKPANLIGSYIFGLAIAFGWTPCIGPIMLGILLIAATQGAIKGMLLLGLYSLGLAVPFVISSLALNAFLFLFKKSKGFFRAIEIASGALLIIAGILVFFGMLTEAISRVKVGG